MRELVACSRFVGEELWARTDLRPKDVDVAELYDSEHYLPKVREVEGKPMFLY